MINNYFGFSLSPFSRNVSHKNLFIWKEFDNVSKRLEYFLKERGIFLLTGLIGAGKTTALRRFAGTINPNTHRVIYINEMFGGKRDFYRTLLEKCEVSPLHAAGDARNLFRKYLQELYCIKQITPVFIFDEAQNLCGFILEEIRLLANVEFDTTSPALFIISGHSLLKQRIALRENEALNQRITIRFHFRGMDLEETCAYIKHCLTVANSTAAIFSDSVLAKIHQASNGVPRKINNICNSLLLQAALSEHKIIDDNLFDQTRGEWEE